MLTISRAELNITADNIARRLLAIVSKYVTLLRQAHFAQAKNQLSFQPSSKLCELLVCRCWRRLDRRGERRIL